MERIFRRGLAVFRWGAWLWLAATLAINWNSAYLRHQWVALFLVGLALGATIVQTAFVPIPLRLTGRRVTAICELSIGLALMIFDGFVRRPHVIFETGPTLGSWWPVIGLLGAATYLPLAGSAICGLLFGVARLLSVVLNQIPLSTLGGNEWLSVANTGAFAMLAAVSVGALMKLLRSAEDEVALARAREEIARSLHDGVLQTLSVVERRTDDKALAQLARRQERELRAFLFGQRVEGDDKDLGLAFMNEAGRFEEIYGGRVQVVLAPDLPETTSKVRHALVGATREALTNAGKHGAAQSITIYLEPAEGSGLFCSIKDDGKGFDPQRTKQNIGLSKSITGRIEEVGGHVEIKSAPGAGAEILLWTP